METIMLPDSWVFTWVILPLLIFLARIMDVSIGTLRLIFVSKRPEGYFRYSRKKSYSPAVIFHDFRKGK